MKLTAVLLFGFSFNLMAFDGSSQQRVNLEVSKASIESILSLIEKNTDYHFVYSENITLKNKFVKLVAKNATIEEVMNQLLKGTPLTYKKLFENLIVISNKLTDISSSKIITGRVRNDKGEAVAGASIILKGTKRGVTTDSRGEFSIDITGEAILQISAVGYQSQEIRVDNNDAVEITLVEANNQMDEVLVVGYGTRKKSDLTGAIASVTAENMKDRAAVNFGEAIAGQLAGVQIQQTNGSPGNEGLTVRIRGTGSITQSSSPLYVVDGYPMEGGAFSLINPSDIESIQILKDASSTAIYGSRGANGVVIINTKKGKSGQPVVSMSSFYGMQQRSRSMAVFNRDQYVEWFIDGRNQAWLDQPIINADPDKTPHTINDPNTRRNLYPSASTLFLIPDGKGGFKYDFKDPKSVAQMPDNNWQDLLFRNAPIQQHDISVSGGSDKTRYSFSGGYINQQGISLNTDYQRFNFRNNVESQLTRNFKLGINLNSYYSNSNEQANGKDAPILYSLILPPIFELQNADGTYGSMVRNPEVLAGDAANPIAIANLLTRNRKRYGWMGTIFGEAQIFKDLIYRLNINGGIQNNDYEGFEPSNVDFDASKAPRPARGLNEKSVDYDWVLEQTLSYKKDLFNRDELVLLAGFTSQKHNNAYSYGEARGFPNDNIITLNAGTMYQLTTTKSNFSMVSYFGRLNYTFDNKYLLTGTVRTDGSSRFGSNKKWGTFPSVSAAWRISQEDFMSGLRPVVNDLKLRASYGVSGNNRIGNYSAIGLLSTGFYPLADALQNTVNPSTIENANLGWEKVLQTNFGIDLGLFNNRVRLETDIYKSKSIDLLLNVPVPTITGYSNQIQNVGKVENKGVEFLLNTKNLTGKLKWNSDFNITFNKNMVLEVGPGGQPIFAGAPNANNSFITKPGYPIASFYGYVYEGIFKDAEDLKNYPHLPADKIGDGRYLDVNGDGVLNQNDKTVLGNNQPKYMGGFSNNFSYKNLSLSTQLSFSYGAKLFSFYKRMVGIYHGDRNALIEQLDRWRSVDQPGDGIHFRPTRSPSGWQRDPSSAWITDGSFIRLRNITLAYDFKNTDLKVLRANNIRTYITGQNLYTWTKYKGFDPENSSQGDGLSRGGDYLGYPAARSLIVGLNITF